MSRKLTEKDALKPQAFEPPLPRTSLFIWIICIGLLVLLIWAWLFKLEEVSTVRVSDSIFKRASYTVFGRWNFMALCA